MRIFYDCEFLDDGNTIDLISIGMVADNGREYYAVQADAPWERIKKNDWLVRNVLPSLPLSDRSALERYLAHPENSRPLPSIRFVAIDVTSTVVKPRQVIANEVRDFVRGVPDPELWAYYAAYDHVALAQLWGPMPALPLGIPMWTNDLKQEAARLRVSVDDLPELTQPEDEHNALADARFNRRLAHALDNLAR